MFGQSTNTPLPQEYLSSYAAWDDFMAGIWADILALMPPRHCVVEVGCGSSLKIGKALAKHGFAGELWVLEASHTALAHTVQAYKALLPNARVIACHGRAEAPHTMLPHAADWLVANHPLDDMLLAYGLDDAALENVFGWTKNPSAALSDALVAAWCQLQQSQQLLAAQAATVQAWQQLVRQLRPRWVGISQYGSSALQANPAMAALNGAAKDVLQQLRTQLGVRAAANMQAVLNTHPHYQNHYIGTEVLDAQHWLVGEWRE